jgi:hypothetical protein
MRLPNWMARFSRPAARNRPSVRSMQRSTRLSPVPGAGVAGERDAGKVHACEEGVLIPC